MRFGGRVNLLEIEPELGAGLDVAALRRLGGVSVSTVLAPNGPWFPDAEAGSGLGLLVLDGLLLRRESLGGRRRAEWIGPGDLIRPASPENRPQGRFPTKVEWQVLSTAVLARLDREVLERLCGAAIVIERLVDRLSRRVARHAQREVIQAEPGLPGKVLAELRLLADLCGRVTRDGIVIPVPLTQSDLADIVGSRRPSLNEAVKVLRHAGVVFQRPDGSWWLAGSADIGSAADSAAAA